MKETFFFWISIEALGLAAFPLAFAFFHRLPDRGYAFSKVIGLLLISYALWIAGTAHVLPNGRLSIILLMLVFAAGSAALAWRRRCWPYLSLEKVARESGP